MGDNLAQIHYIHIAYSCPICKSITHVTIDLADFHDEEFLETTESCDWCKVKLTMLIDNPDICIRPAPVKYKRIRGVKRSKKFKEVKR